MMPYREWKMDEQDLIINDKQEIIFKGNKLNFPYRKLEAASGI
jgi:hypothetical protein